MGFGEAVQSVFSKYATFSGRARRSEYWYFVLLQVIVTAVLTAFIPQLSRLHFRPFWFCSTLHCWFPALLSAGAGYMISAGAAHITFSFLSRW